MKNFLVVILAFNFIQYFHEGDSYKCYEEKDLHKGTKLHIIKKNKDCDTALENLKCIKMDCGDCMFTYLLAQKIMVT
uniref:Uncharacterized protein n=1 Tax=Meloidogyne hapla TaxID=6305 RepID=A0A1I8B506_MELHA